jgi:dethiobiotin synthetase
VDADMPFIVENIATLQRLIPAPCLGIVPRLAVAPSTPFKKTAAQIAHYLQIETLLHASV